MAKAQHSPAYRAVPPLLRRLREDAGLSQRDLGAKMRRPQSWVYNCETANRRVDITELIAWCRACSADPLVTIGDLVKGRH
jgi:transcriptional regulator with XRE-family HTH domain